MHSGSITLFIEGKSPLHSDHPFNKLAYVLLAGLAAYGAPGAWIPDAVLLGLNLVLAGTNGILSAVWKITWRMLLPLALLMIPIHGFLYPGNHTPLVSYHNILFGLEGLVFSGTKLLQLATVFTASLLFVFTTHPADFITALTQAGWPPFMAYLMGSPLLMLPAMRTRIGVIQAAQRARGLDVEGGPLKRIRSLVPLVVPFVLGALIEIEQRAIALEIRGFNASGAKTSLRMVHDSKAQRTTRWLMVLASILLLLSRLAV
ncbi:energy-coupling factor transporter transmembrane component T family protein [Desulfosarcina ovata]|uniref:Energy-coupling factor transporter transmembrane protein EcfT n=1 Tax=Desulfosarcina ovata subsp. ovata TaxID=2752305 RepID=A0A5K8AAK4_9BACT|nr:energy-coupling factor transporter transmembrane component T [Desulfosarcina ovata]BBO89743.1 hypothetical protein DSCOOX_29230 [Desulfosarcina ovata subsp. ovata]